MFLKAFLITAFYFHPIDLQQFDPISDYKNISLTMSPETRNCSFKLIEFYPVRVSDTPLRLTPRKTTCLQSVLNCVQSPARSSDISCSDRFATISMFLDGVRFRGGIVAQPSPETPINQSSLRICRRGTESRVCSITTGRHSDLPHRMQVMVDYNVESSWREDDDCSGFREFFAAELEGCEKTVAIMELPKKPQEMHRSTVLTVICWFYPSVEVIVFALYDLIIASLKKLARCLLPSKRRSKS